MTLTGVGRCYFKCADTDPNFMYSGNLFDFYKFYTSVFMV
jgi:hypothetical protein